MKIGRNDPCPCGSSKKYKRCCARLEESTGAAPGQGGLLRKIAAESDQWFVDILAMGVAESEPAGRNASALVVAGGLVLSANIVSSPSAEAKPFAAELLLQVEAASASFGASPKSVSVVDEEVAEALRELVAERPEGSGWSVVAGGDRSEFEAAAVASRSRANGGTDPGAVSSPLTWEAWGLPEDHLKRFFAAVAQYWQEENGKSFPDWTLFELAHEDAKPWIVAPFGSDEEAAGLNLLQSPVDAVRLATGLITSAADLSGPVLTFYFSQGSELPTPMRREFARQGYEVASPEAYPYLVSINTRAGGVSEHQLALLTGAFKLFGKPLSEAKANGLMDDQDQFELRQEANETDLALSLRFSRAAADAEPEASGESASDTNADDGKDATSS